ncbi:MAG: F0F1 ATP synthase subunit gamma [Clostridia bacterium]|nr:F0F1 ATP synthase subunit gamma [Clostridia bacterium]
MPTIQNLKKKLQVILSTKKLTQAMKTASTVKYSKLSALYSDYEKYAEQCDRMYHYYRKDFNSFFSVSNPEAPSLYIVLTSNKGMCGSFNTELISFFENILREPESEPVIICCGKKGKDYLDGKKIRYDKSYIFSDIPLYSDACALLEDIRAMTESGKISSVKIVYPRYQNMMKQKPVCDGLFSFGEDTAESEEPLFVPDRQTVMVNTAEKILISILYKKILETALGAQAATLTTMRSAYDTACEYSIQLETEINRKRQSQVTADVLEVSADYSKKGEV